jgi:hypothetical protein
MKKEYEMCWLFDMGTIFKIYHVNYMEQIDLRMERELKSERRRQGRKTMGGVRY